MQTNNQQTTNRFDIVEQTVDIKNFIRGNEVSVLMIKRGFERNK